MWPLDLQWLRMSLLPRGPSHHDAPSSGDFASARVVEGDWEPVRTWSRRVSSPERLRDELELIHTKITQHREIIDFIRARGMSPANHYYRDLDLLHAEYDQLSQTLLESREAFASSRRRGSPDVASPACRLLPLRLHVQILRHARGFACHLSLALPHLGINDSLLKIVLVHETPQAIVPVNVEFQKIAHASDSSLAISLATAIRFRGFPLSKASPICFRGFQFTSASALIPCLVW